MVLCIWRKFKHFSSYHVLNKTTETKALFNTLFSIIKGYQIKDEDRGTFEDCQMCRKNDCCFISCHYLLNSSIFCQNVSDTSQRHVTANNTMSKECLTGSTLTSIISTSDELFSSTSTTRNYDKNQLPSSNGTQQTSSN